MKDPRELTPKVQTSLMSKRQASGATHTYAQEPVLKIHPQVPVVAAPKKKKLPQTTAVAKEWNQQASQTAACSSHLESSSQSDVELSPERVKRWKNPAAMVRKMQQSASSTAKMSKKISVVSEEPGRQQEKMQDELWQELMKNPEERQFHLGRITNFFT